jgi:uncharacterized iron-regulated protein
MVMDRLRAAAAALLLLAAGAAPAAHGQIIRLASGDSVPFREMVADLAQADVVLVGERHDDFAHHWVQNQVISGLLAKRRVAVAMEAFASDKDPVLADWRRGRFDAWIGFLAGVDWFRHWGVDPGLYAGILETVKRHRLPLAGMNVPRQWIARIGREGMGALDPDQRQRIGPVAPAPEAYAEALRESLSKHDGGRSAGNFIAAQTAWDAAMAGALIDLRQAHPDRVVVGLAGTGHIRGGHGIPHQLRSRDGELSVRTVLPYSPKRDRPASGAADYAWAVAPDRAREAVRIGAQLDGQGSGRGIRVAGLEADGPGARAGLVNGDRILAVDGHPVRGATELIYRIRRNRWGGCLRLTILRDGDERSILVPLERPEKKPG